MDGSTIAALVVIGVILLSMVGGISAAYRSHQQHYLTEENKQQEALHITIPSRSPSSPPPDVLPPINGWWFIWWWWTPILKHSLHFQRIPSIEVQKTVVALWRHRDSAYSSDTDKGSEDDYNDDEREEEQRGDDMVVIVESDPPRTHEGPVIAAQQDDELAALKQAGAAYDFEAILQRDTGQFLLLLQGCLLRLDFLYRKNGCKLSPRKAFVRNKEQDTPEEYTQKFTATDYTYLVGSQKDKTGLLRKAGVITTHKEEGYDCWPYDTVEEAWATLVSSSWFLRSISKEEEEE